MNNVELYSPHIEEEFGMQPCSYNNASYLQIIEHTGGCGPGGIGDYMVPDTAWFLSVRRACARHDWLYHWGLTQEEKDLADLWFLNNMVRIVKAQNSSALLEKLRLRRVRTYYLAVKYGGGPAYWKNKHHPGELA